MNTQQDATEKKKRGFASLSPERRKEIASKGGKNAHMKGKAHKFNSDTAREAGKKGGQSVSQDREYMSEIGRKGGENSAVSKGYQLQTLPERPKKA